MAGTTSYAFDFGDEVSHDTVLSLLICVTLIG